MASGAVAGEAMREKKRRLNSLSSACSRSPPASSCPHAWRRGGARVEIGKKAFALKDPAQPRPPKLAQRGLARSSANSEHQTILAGATRGVAAAARTTPARRGTGRARNDRV